jgi:hypothetical protein
MATDEAGKMTKHHDDDGGNTVELKGRASVPAANRSVPPPAGVAHKDQAAVDEQLVRTRGNWMTVAGVVVSALTFALNIVWNEGFDGDMPVGYVLPLYAIGFGAVAVGGMEYLSRHHRKALVEQIQQSAKIERGLFALVDLMDEQLQQRWYGGYGTATREQLRQTGTDSHAGRRAGTGDVLRFRQRNDSPLS